MLWVEFFKTHKKTLRILYWSFFVLFMILIGLPSFFFFYLFDEERTKQMLIERFDHQRYKVEVSGRVVPKVWHGLSLELGSININSQKNKSLIQFNNVSCQLSWLDLLIGKFKVNRLAVNGVEINEKNIISNGFYNLLDFSKNQDDVFSKVKILDIYNVNVLGDYGYHSVVDGDLRFERGHDKAIFQFQLKLAKTNTSIAVEGALNNFSDGVLHIDNFIIKSYDKLINTTTTAKGIYDTKTQKLIVSDIASKVSGLNYLGDINIDQVNVFKNQIDVNNVKGRFNFSDKNTKQVVNAQIDKIILKNFEQLSLGQLNLKYILTMGQNQITVDSKAVNFITLKDRWQISSSKCTNNIKYTSPHFVDQNGLQATLSGACSVNLKTKLTNLKLKGTFNNAPAMLKLQFISKNERPYIRVDGTMDSLDFSRIKLQTEKILPLYNDNSSLPFKWLSLIDMDANLSVKKFALDRIVFGNLATNLKLSKSELNIYKLSADIYNGKLSGVAKITKLNINDNNDQNNNEDIYSISINQKLYGLNLQKMLDDLLDVKAISGGADLLSNINMNGVKSYEDLHKKLNGKVTVNAKNGAFKGVDFNLFANSAKIEIPNNSQSTIFDHMVANFNFTNGISKNGNLNFYSKYVDANGNGTISFVNNTINYKLNIKSILPKNEQHINLVVIPVMVSGDLFNPKVYIQNMHLSSNLSQKNKLKNVVKKTKIKIANKYKNLKAKHLKHIGRVHSKLQH